MSGSIILLSIDQKVSLAGIVSTLKSANFDTYLASHTWSNLFFYRVLKNLPIIFLKGYNLVLTLLPIYLVVYFQYLTGVFFCYADVSERMCTEVLLSESADIPTYSRQQFCLQGFINIPTIILKLFLARFKQSCERFGSYIFISITQVEDLQFGSNKIFSPLISC